MPQPDVCGYIGVNPIVCCEPGPEMIKRPTTTLPGDMKTISQRKCDEYAEAVYVENSVSFFGSQKENTCAAVVEALIVNGNNTEPREYPHMALIGYGEKNSIQYLCGGSLISERYVLSAAHCTDSGRQYGVARWARLGEYNIHSTEDEDVQNSGPEVYEIIERIDHPQYKSPRLYNDIALYKLDRDVSFNEFIRPCCLSYNPQENYHVAIATGWGHTEWGGRGSDILQKVSLNITDTRECNNSYQTSVGKQLPNGILPQSMLCAGDLLKGGDTCQGDSGGPLQILLKSPYCMYSLIGVTSFGKDCGSYSPGVYTRVSHFIPWIESIVWPS